MPRASEVAVVLWLLDPRSPHDAFMCVLITHDFVVFLNAVKLAIGGVPCLAARSCPPEAVRNMAYTHDKATMPAIHNVMQQARSCNSACIGDGLVDLAWLGLLTVDSSLYL